MLRAIRQEPFCMRLAVLLLSAISLSACTTGGRQAAPANTDFVDRGLVQATPVTTGAYQIGPLDKLALRVLQVEDLSFEEIYVDASGNLQLPLLGSVRAAGLTPGDLSREIEHRLGERYLRNPQVVVTVLEAADQKVTVDGAVRKPGVYKMQGRVTLMQAVAMAEGPTNVAALDQVAVFRNVDGRPMVAVFDLREIRGGRATDPTLLGDDVVVVDTSRLSATIREVLQALPGIAVFGYL